MNKVLKNSDKKMLFYKIQLFDWTVQSVNSQNCRSLKKYFKYGL